MLSTTYMNDSLSEYETRVFNDPFFGQAMKLCWEHNKPLEHKVIVEVGCGSGETSVLFALHGAKVIGVDISREMIKNSNELAKKWQVENKCHFLNGNTEALPLSDCTADIIFSRSTMQYLDRTLVIPECLRILKPGGTMVLIENLPFNPFMKIYRSIKRLNARSPKDVAYQKSLKGYVTQSEFDELSARFNTTVRQNYHLFRMFPMLLGLKIDSTHGVGNIIRQIDLFFFSMDIFLLEKLPFLAKNAWFTCFIGKQKK